MVSSTFLAVFVCGLALCSAQSGQGQEKPECADEVKAFGECMRENGPEPPKMDFQTIKTEADKCFTDNGCKAPDFGSFRGQNGPGGRAGPPPGGDSCFQTVHQKIHKQFEECMKEKDPDFGKFGGRGGRPGGGPGGPFGGPPPGGPFQGPPPGGPPPGGPFGQHPGGPPPGGPPPIEMLAQLCDNDNAKTEKLQACLKDVHEKNKPSKEEVKKHFDELCKASQTCKPKLGACEDSLKKKGQFACECHEQSHAKADEIFSQEASCASKQKPPLPGPPNGEKPDCSKPPPNPCDEGFDKFYERFSKFPPPPPPMPPPQ